MTEDRSVADRHGGLSQRALLRAALSGGRPLRPADPILVLLSRSFDVRSKWLQALVIRRGFNRAVVALANKTARIAWALVTQQEIYRAA